MFFLARRHFLSSHAVRFCLVWSSFSTGDTLIRFVIHSDIVWHCKLSELIEHVVRNELRSFVIPSPFLKRVKKSGWVGWHWDECGKDNFVNHTHNVGIYNLQI